MVFPAWNAAGVLPAVRPGVAGHDPDRSPYVTSLENFFDYFCFSRERLAIARGLMEYRNELHKAGLSDGFKWLNGSFSENIEANDARSPNDIDVVTFFHIPKGHIASQILNKNKILFDKDAAKTNYRVDAYFNQLGLPQGPGEVKRISYWYSMWSHRRDGLWKGFVQVDLSPKHDGSANSKLDAIDSAMARS